MVGGEEGLSGYARRGRLAGAQPNKPMQPTAKKRASHARLAAGGVVCAAADRQRSAVARLFSMLNGGAAPAAVECSSICGLCVAQLA